MGYVTISQNVDFDTFLDEVDPSDYQDLAERVVSMWNREEMLRVVFDDCSTSREVDLVSLLYSFLSAEKQIEFYNLISGSDAMMSTVSASMKAAKLALEQLQDAGRKVVENINLALEKMEK